MFKRNKWMPILSILMIFTLLFTACGGGSKPTAADTDTKTAEEQQPKEETADQTKEEEKASEPEKPTIDMKGKPVRVVSWGYAGGEAGTEAGDKRIELEKELEKKYNTKFQFSQIPWDGIQDKVTASIMAGEPIADVFLLDRYRAIPTMVQKDFLMPVDDVLDIDSGKWPKNLREMGGFGGKVYGFATSLGGGGGIYYNRKILKNEGLPDPQELDEKGEWNWDTFLDIAKKATKDTNGDGKIDQYGLALSHKNFVPAIIASNNADVTKEENGTLTFDGDSPNAMEALHFVSDLYNVHKVVKPNQSGNWDDYITSFNQGNIAMRYGEGWEGGGIKENLGKDYGFTYIPKGPKATDYANVTTPSFWFVPKGANPDAVRIYAEYIFGYMPPEGEVDEYVEQQFADEKSLQVYEDLGNIMKPKNYEGIPNFGDKINDAWAQITAGKESPETAMKKVRPVLEGLLKESLK
ncbi:extracellular solute-binding protein [Paenibacillus sp. VCA1]|uniref:ABC transporter substrate-binding protein n=1 Tax=Paenibacillus sp. VCA1 TaxID=3039148 RepID=UPI00287133E4|nr:extracellular solute-binding protein [Paenibacillus sp. VCA1]MDR9855718.1 extracellular solute-binding protein [Paenibacillus sp. VCA1]